MNRFFALILVFLAQGCVSPDAGPPPVDLEKIAPVLVDLQIAEALSAEVPVLIRDSVKQVYYHRVLKDYEMSQATFDSLTWIIRQEPIWVDSLYTRVGILLAKLEADRKQ